MHGLAVYDKEGLPFALDLSLENSADSYLCFRLALLHSVSSFFFLYWLPSSSLCTVFYSISSSIDEVLSINPSAVFVFRDFNIHHKGWLTYSGGIDWPCELCYNFSIWNNITQMVNFPTRVQTPVQTCSFGFIYQWYSLHWEILIMLLSQFPLTFHKIHNRILCFITQLMTILTLIGMVFMIIWDVPWEDIFKLGVSAAASELYKWAQVGNDVYNPRRKY